MRKAVQDMAGRTVSGLVEAASALTAPPGSARMRQRRMETAIRVLACLPLVISSLAAAQGGIDTDIERHGVHRHEVISKPYKLQASALRSGMLPAAAAARHGIDVAADRGALNVLVLKEQDGRQVSVPADITAITIDLLGQAEPIDMRQVVENEHISYIGSFAYQPARNLRFVIDALPRAATEHLALEFEDRFEAPR